MGILPPPTLGVSSGTWTELETVADWILSPSPTLGLDEETHQRLAGCRAFLTQMVEEGRRIYGVTTGYGPLATQHISPVQSAQLQQNLVYHLASGVGPPLSPLHARAVMLTRLLTLLRGHSAIRPETAQLMVDCLNRDILPVIPCMGTVGASGDLTPLAHLALALMGQGQVFHEGQTRPAADALAEAGLTPLSLTAKEGLALVNGTAAMTGIAVVNAAWSARLLDWSLALSCLFAEVMHGRSEAYDPAFAEVRAHAGQRWAVEALHGRLARTQRLKPYAGTPPLLSEIPHTGVLGNQPILQDPYTVRCIPQVLGAVKDVVDFHHRITETELNAVTDNPLFFPENAAVLHGGNFFGQHIAFASDALMPAVIQLAGLAELQVARLSDPLLNGGLPAFLQGHHTGLHSGFMGAQVTASALLAEMRTLAVPASCQSIPTNNNNQDIVPMGTIAARKVAHLLERASEVLAIQALMLAQAVELLPREAFSPAGLALVAQVREVSAFLAEDRPLSTEIQAMAQMVRAENPAEGINTLV